MEWGGVEWGWMKDSGYIDDTRGVAIGEMKAETSCFE